MSLIVLSQLLEIDNISRDNSICSYSHKCPSLRSRVFFLQAVRGFFLHTKNRGLLRRLQVPLMYLTLSFDSFTALHRVQASLVTHWFYAT